MFEQLTYDPHKVVHTSTAGLYRTIEELPPTVLFDEMDMHKLSKVAKGILNSGYKSGAFVAIMDGRRSRRLHT